MPKTEGELRAQLQRLQVRDEVLRSEVAKFEVDQAKSRVIDLNFWAPDEHTAKRMRDVLRRNEFVNVLVLSPGLGETNQRWLVRGSFTATLDFITAKENVATFLLLADEYDCEYDGWGTAIVEGAGYRA